MTLAIRIIPCLDIQNGRIVKGVNFVDICDAGDPVEAAIRYQEQGADEIAILDISASIEERKTMLDVVYKIADNLLIPLTVGGGIKTVDDIGKLLKAGADKISINSQAVINPSFVKEAADRFGNQCIIVALDVKQVSSSPPKWELFTHGGKKDTHLDAIMWAQKMVALGAGEILLTSMDKDGTKTGFDLDIIKKISAAVSVPIIASGGVGNLDHLVEGVNIGKADAVLAASIFHFNHYTIKQAKQHMQNHGICVRL